ncbi:hypothetical protein ACFLZ3_00660 [Candidatus Omnitrophota bacterium]
MSLKRRCIILFVLLSASLITGCATLRGMSEDFSKGVEVAAQGVKHGSRGIVKLVENTDGWIRENLW